MRVEDVGEDNVQQPPVLAVEVLSPGTRARDQLLKRGVYAESGIPSYWLVDPDAPSLTVLWLGEGGGYDEVAVVHGEETYDATRPFAVSVRPAALISAPGATSTCRRAQEVQPGAERARGKPWRCPTPAGSCG